MSNPNLSVVILAKDEEKNIPRTIKSVEEISDEIIVIDDGSRDFTIKVAKKLGAKVFRRKLESFARQRNFGLAKAKGEWVLFLDADEFVGEKLSAEITKATKSNLFKGYFLRRKDLFLSSTMNFGEAGGTRVLRLARKSAGKWVRSVHETWKVRGLTRTLRNFLNHNSHVNISSFVDKVNNFSTLHATSNKKEGKRASIIKVTFWPLGKFLYNYILKLGFLDGTRGFVFAGMMSSHSFLAWSKLWMEKQKVK